MLQRSVAAEMDKYMYMNIMCIIFPFFILYNFEYNLFDFSGISFVKFDVPFANYSMVFVTSGALSNCRLTASFVLLLVYCNLAPDLLIFVLTKPLTFHNLLKLYEEYTLCNFTFLRICSMFQY